jgi:uncharacterized membrane protein AbrB (regulator of aidB expression)
MSGDGIKMIFAIAVAYVIVIIFYALIAVIIRETTGIDIVIDTADPQIIR